jgi:hypothetical protein
MLTACFEEQMKLFAIENCMTEMNVIFLVSLVGIVGLEYIGGNFWGDFLGDFLGGGGLFLGSDVVGDVLGDFCSDFWAIYWRVFWAFFLLFKALKLATYGSEYLQPCFIFK